MKVRVVGSGLAGSIVARVFRNKGIETEVWDDGDRFSASRASSNLYIASWVKKFAAPAKEGLKILESLGLEVDQPFAVGMANAAQVKHVRDVLVEPDVRAKAEPNNDRTVWCTGYRESSVPISVKVGHALYFSGDLPDGESRLGLVSPYTHEKLYQLAPGVIYYADSVAVKLETYEKRRAELQDRSLRRAQLRLRNRFPLRDLRVGYRPIIAEEPFGVWGRKPNGDFYVNGGGKNGLVAYAYRAAQLAEELS